jgi:RNA polymerase sigma-70 factor (ECF subfamily)
MTGEQEQAWVADFEAQRVRLKGLAYRMLGSVAEAEDVVQDAFLRVHAIDARQVSDLAGYLYTTVARLCLDRIKSARSRREQYVGTWLPEPVVETESAPDAQLELADDLSFALLLTLERLTPPERTAFLLHDVFGQDFAGIAEVLSRSEAACRKLAERARSQVALETPRFQAKAEDEQRLVQAFFTAAFQGDAAALMQLLAEDAVLYTDGGGHRRAAHKPVYGADRITRFFVGVSKHPARAPEPVTAEPRRINQLPGIVVRYSDGDVHVAAVEIREGRIVRIYIINNPDKLNHLRR